MCSYCLTHFSHLQYFLEKPFLKHQHDVNIINLCMLVTLCIAEEEKKRKRESSFSAVGFSYANMASSSVSREEKDEDPPLLACYPQQLEHPPTSSVDQGGEGEEEYIPPPGLIIPANIKPVSDDYF